MRHIIAHAKKVWPSPATVPTGWSCAWEEWPLMLTFYWFSPYYLMLPQIEMLVNIRYAIPGETRPLLFHAETHAFFFTLVADSTRFFFWDQPHNTLYRVQGVQSADDLAVRVEADFPTLQSSMIRLETDPAGEDAINRILARDETVIPVLTQFLDYTPTPTQQMEEGTARYAAGLSEEQQLELYKGLMSDAADMIKKYGEPYREERETGDKRKRVDDKDFEAALNQVLDDIDSPKKLDELEAAARAENEGSWRK